MLTRDSYIALLTKTASYGEPDYEVDSQEVALKNRKDNMSDSRTYLRSLFDSADTAEKAQSKEIGKLLPGNEEKESGSALLKVAFFQAIAESGLSKTASAAYIAVTFHGFQNELEKIASILPAPQAVAQANQELGGFKSLVRPPAQAGGMAAGIGNALKKIPVGGAIGKLR